MSNVFLSGGRRYTAFSVKLDMRCGVETIMCKTAGKGVVCDTVSKRPMCVLIDGELINDCMYELIGRLRWNDYGFGRMAIKESSESDRICGEIFVMYSDEIDKHKIEKAFSVPLTEDEAIDILRVAIYEPFGNGMAEKMKTFFAKIGLYCNLSGYDYLMTAVEEVGKDNTLIKKLTRGLYPLVGRKYGTTGSIVERSIRNAINNTYNSGKLREVINGQYGGNLAEYEKPTNGEMIAFLYEMVR